VNRPVFSLGNRQIGGEAPCFIIAEAGVNHDGDPEAALALVEAAAAAGADAVKFQTFRASELVTATAPQAAYQTRNLGEAEAQRAMLERLELGPDVFASLKARAEAKGLLFLSTPFDSASALLLHRLGVAAFKLGSGELTNLPFLAEIAALGRPMIISTGMADLDECLAAAAAIQATGPTALAVLHCVSCYPAPPEQYNLRALDSLATALPTAVIGLSDHSLGNEVSLAGVARGAAVLEKHLTLDRHRRGPDHAASAEPGEFAALVRQVRLVESALGDGIKRPMPCEGNVRQVARRSLVAARDLPAGHRLSVGDLRCKRPGTGLSPGRLREILGRRLKRPLPAEALLALEDLG